MAASRIQNTNLKVDQLSGSSVVRLKSNYSTFVTVLVGLTKTPIIVHNDLLRARSKYFESALSRGDDEAIGCELLSLPNWKPIAFQIYVESIYDGKADLGALAAAYADDIISKPEEGGVNIASSTGYALCTLWTLGDFLEDVEFKDKIVKSILDGRVYGVSMSLTSAAVIWAHSKPDSGMRKLLIDWMLPHITPTELAKHSSGLEASLLSALLASYIELVGDRVRRPGPGGTKKYLEHE